MSTIYIVIPVYNRRNVTLACLNCVKSQTYSAIQTIVVDDGSKDGTSEMIKANFPDVDIIRGDGSWYWTAAVYEGVKRALTRCKDNDHIMVLNDDLILQDNFIELMMRSARSHPNSLLHPCTAYEGSPDIIRFGGVEINWWTGKTKYANRGKRISSFSEGFCQPSSVLWGQGLLIPANILKEIGNYDRRIVHRGDPELPRRAAKKGYKLLVSYDAVVRIPIFNDLKNIERHQYSLSDIRDYYSHVLSHANIKMLYASSMLMARSKIQGLTYFLFCMARTLYLFCRGLRRF